ncbi:hypothetical protein [Streptomyces silvensis]|uniref:Gram-positive cocci surface proteins LPxTG domain-containing protein n=1 Tax=Streptomyces silvensis TaxID=1765722 RepID=A0A0W7WV95_9ACTN|nr:hypothetical protein [Streptomyces silvensis]KUF14498.1 hypothetical protein AT728_32070 [Streptomyces silvensis]
MRPSAPHLALTLTTAALCALAATAPAYAENTATAEVTPRHAAPGRHVTVSVTCPAAGDAPATMDGHSQAFEGGTVRLERTGHHRNKQQHHQDNRNSGEDPLGAPGPGKASANALEPGDDTPPGEAPPDGGNTSDTSYDTGTETWTETETETETGTGTETETETDTWTETETETGTGTRTETGTGTHTEAGTGTGTGSTGTVYRGTARIADASAFEGGGPNAVGPESEWAVDGTCHGDGRWKATFTVTRTAHTATHTAPGVSRGVHAGRTGGFTDSPPALAAGVLLVVVALGAAVHRLRRDRGFGR